MTNKVDRQDELRNRWLPLIKRQKTSGQSVAEFCRQHRLNYHQMLYWKGREKSGNKRIPASSSQITAPSDSTNTFVEVVVPKQESIETLVNVLRIVTSYGATIEVPL